MTVALRRVRAQDLDAAALYELLKLRVEVFVGVPHVPMVRLASRTEDQP